MKIHLFCVFFVCIVLGTCESRPPEDIPIRVLDGLTNVVRVLVQGMKNLQGIILDAILNQAQNGLSSVEESASDLLNITQSVLSKLIDANSSTSGFGNDDTNQTDPDDTGFLRVTVQPKLGIAVDLLNTTTQLLHNLHNSTADLILQRVESIGNLLSITTPLILSIASRAMDALDYGVTSFNGVIDAKLNAATVLLNETVTNLMNTVANETETLSNTKILAAHTVLNASTTIMSALNGSAHEWIGGNANLLTDIIHSTLGILNTVSNRTNNMNGIRRNLTRIMDNITEHGTTDVSEQSFQEIQKLLTLIGSSLEQRSTADMDDALTPTRDEST